MSTNNAENVNLKLKIPNDEQKKTCNFKVFTLDKLLVWIDKQTLDEKVKTELIKKAKNYPTFALPSFVKNFQKHLSKAQKSIRDSEPLHTKELGD